MGHTLLRRPAEPATQTRGCDGFSEGDVVLTGTISGKMDFDPSDGESIVEFPNNYSMGFIAKYTADGIFQWSMEYANKS